MPAKPRSASNFRCLQEGLQQAAALTDELQAEKAGGAEERRAAASAIVELEAKLEKSEHEVLLAAPPTPLTQRGLVGGHQAGSECFVGELLYRGSYTRLGRTSKLKA